MLCTTAITTSNTTRTQTGANTECFTGRMPILPPNQQRQSTEGTKQVLARRLRGQLTDYNGQQVVRPSGRPNKT